VISSDSEVSWSVTLVGISHTSIAGEAGSMERLHDSRSMVAGWEYIEKGDWARFAEEISHTARRALKASTPPPGRFKIVADPDLVGLILHEAFGHASEGDLVASGTSILRGRIGEQVASDLVTLIDSGDVEGGFLVPYDDEGTPKEKTEIISRGILKTHLTDRISASKLGIKPTGNGRAQDFESPPIVRQTNIYIEPRDWGFEEMIRETREGLYLLGRGSVGGQVDTSMGTFTFSAGPSYIIRKGELGEMVKGVVISGYILETLKGVEAVGRDLVVRTSVFGGCGKDGQLVRVGDGGPHIMIREIIVGGR
jgi:TldD protein